MGLPSNIVIIFIQLFSGLNLVARENCCLVVSCLVLWTPSKSFRHCPLPRVIWGVLWEVKSMSGIFKSSYGGKLFLCLCKLKWFKSKQIWVDGNVFICSQGPYRAVNSDRYLATLFCVQHTLLYILGEVGPGFLTLWRRQLSDVLHRLDTLRRIVTKSLYRTALPFSILKASWFSFLIKEYSNAKMLRYSFSFAFLSVIINTLCPVPTSFAVV